MKKLLTGLLLALGAALSVQAAEPAPEHAPEEAGVLPGTGHIMIEMGYRYSALYFAGQQKHWDFAAYQLEEIEEALERLAHLKPKHASNVGQFRGAVVGELEQALSARSGKRFAAAFEKLRAECMACHAKSGVEFIVLSVPKEHYSPALE